MRLDNTSPVIIKWFDLKFDENDPGMTQPVDICRDCFEEDIVIFTMHETDHPSYNDDEYTCELCNCTLIEWED